MNCEICGAALNAETLLCPDCGAKYTRVCVHCGAAAEAGETVCPVCGGDTVPGLDMTRAEMVAEGMKCFMPYSTERVFHIYLGGNQDGGGYVFHNLKGYTADPPKARLVLPGLVEGMPIYGIWNEFFCVGDEFIDPQEQAAAYERNMQIKEVVVSNGVQEAFTYSFFGCAGLEVLELPRSLRAMKNDFYDLFMDGKETMGNGVKKTPITIRYHGTAEDWAQVAVTSRFTDYVNLGCLKLEFLGRDNG